MKNMICMLCLLILMSGAVVAEELQVEVPTKGLHFTYDQPVRVNRVLDDIIIHKKGSYFPLASQLFDLTREQDIQLRRDEVFKKIAAYEKVNPDAGWLLKQLKRETYLSRQFISLDRNAVMSQLGHNPLLSGHFALYLYERPEYIQLYGAVKSSHNLPWLEHANLTDYLAELPSTDISESSDPSTAFVIYPDGVVSEVSYAYWNFSPTYFAPGSIIFLGFDSLPNELSTLNQDVVELLRHKVNL